MQVCLFSFRSITTFCIAYIEMTGPFERNETLQLTPQLFAIVFGKNSNCFSQTIRSRMWPQRQSPDPFQLLERKHLVAAWGNFQTIPSHLVGSERTTDGATGLITSRHVDPGGTDPCRWLRDLLAGNFFFHLRLMKMDRRRNCICVGSLAPLTYWSGAELMAARQL